MAAITSKNRYINEYRRLLVSEWKKDFPDEVLALLWGVVSEHLPEHPGPPLLRLLNPDYNSEFPNTYFESIVHKISEATGFIRWENLPALPAAYTPPKRSSKSVWRANRLSGYLTLPAHARLRGDVDFFVEVQALAFQAAIHHVLPEVRGKHAAEHAILLHAAALFALGYSASDPAHYSYMISIVHDYLGNEDQRLQTLYTSFRCTSPFDHSTSPKPRNIGANCSIGGGTRRPKNSCSPCIGGACRINKTKFGKCLLTRLIISCETAKPDGERGRPAAATSQVLRRECELSFDDSHSTIGAQCELGRIMAKTETIRTRVDSKLEARAEEVFNELGLTPSDAIRLFYRQVALRKGLPFDVAIPNAATRRAMRDIEAGRNLLGPFDDTEQMFRALGISTDGPRPERDGREEP
jgi:DNA-damage-inducible protein J